MTRGASVFNHGEFAGRLEELDDGSFRFTYAEPYLAVPAATAISLTLPKQPEPHVSPTLFSFFYGLLAEGSTRTLQARTLKIDETDVFGLLAAVGGDLIGSVTVRGDEEAR